jgi:hypothetical protein
MANQPITPQDQLTDNQDILNLDISQLFDTYMTPIDQHRVKNAGKYTESRCNAYYRVIGFPVISNSGGMHSTGFDPDLNSNTDLLSKNQGIDNEVINDTSITLKQLDPREQVFKDYATIFGAGGFNAIALTLGSMFIRAFDQQFSDGLGALDFDGKQVQFINDRFAALRALYDQPGGQQDAFAALSPNLASEHLLKPFIVDPRIANNLNNISKSVAAPFLKDASKLNIFPAGGNNLGALKRPFIEQVISIRFDNTNYFRSSFVSDAVNTLISDIQTDPTKLDPELLAITNNPSSVLQNSDTAVFNNYIKLIRAIIDELVDTIADLTNIRQTVNFQPIPDKAGIENGGTVNTVDPNDPNNKQIEISISDLQDKSDVNNLSFIIKIGLNSVPDPGSFVFGLDDHIFIANKNEQKSYDQRIQALNDNRNQVITQGINDLQTIEMIMGEFSGLGLIDIIAIQLAFFLMSREDLLGLIDDSAFTRAQTRSDLNFSGISRNTDALASLKSFETNLQNIYLIIQAYYNQVFNGTKFNAS